MVSADEKSGGRQHPRFLLEGFNHAIVESGLEDLSYVGEKLTWERFRGSEKWIQERLDRGLATKDWKDLFLLLKFEYLRCPHRIIYRCISP